MAFITPPVADRIQRRFVELEDNGYAPFDVVIDALREIGLESISGYIIVEPEDDLENIIRALKAQGAERASDFLARAVARRCTELLREREALRGALAPFIKS